MIVTSTCVYQCRQKRSPEQLFEDLALNPKTQEKAEEFGITYRLDVCGLYKVRLTFVLSDSEDRLTFVLSAGEDRLTFVLSASKGRVTVV